MDPIQFSLQSTGVVTLEFLHLGIHDFLSACTYIQQLPYKRISNRESIVLVLKEQCGTCSSKHAILAALAHENGYKDIELTIGIYPMSEKNTPELKGILPPELPYIPEAHVYLLYKHKRYDYTRMKSIPLLDNEILQENTVSPCDIGMNKIALHKEFIEEWRKDNTTLNTEEIWNLREQCIKRLGE